MVEQTTRPTGGSVLDNSIANQTFTREELAEWMNENPENAISFAISRNPSVIYKFIRNNYGNAYPLITQGLAATNDQMDSMEAFLNRQYGNLSPEQRPHFIANLLYSLPTAAELQNWTTPVN